MNLTRDVRIRLRTALQARVEMLDDDHLVACCILSGYTFSEIQDFVRAFS